MNKPKKTIVAAVAGLLIVGALVVPTKAITTGKWDLSGIPDLVQKVAEKLDKEPEQEKPETPHWTQDQKNAIYQAIAEQRAKAKEFWKVWRR